MPQIVQLKGQLVGAIEGKILGECNLVLCRDWNMVELKEDKSSVCGKIILERERLSWGALKLVLDISEPVRSEKSLIP
jgi:hypothetical protein